MIKGVSGVPGSGKTYFVVKEISDKYFTFDKNYSEWTIKEKYKDILIFTNVKGFKLNAIQLDDFYIRNNITYETFFTVPYIEELKKQYPDSKIIILIDEAQKFFPSDYKNKDVLFFFQYHRHLGIDLYLTYQSWSSMSRKITDLMEFEIRAVRQSLKVANEFRYHFYCVTDKIGGTMRKADKMVFALYKSFDAKSIEKPPRPARRLLALVAVLLVCMYVGIHLFVSSFTNKSPSSVAIAADPPGRVVPVASRPAKVSQAGGGSVRPTTPAKPEPVKQLELPESVTRIQLGGIWIGNRLVGIEFFGRVVPIRDFTYPFIDDYENKTVLAMIPDSILGQVQRVQTGGYIRQGENWSLMGQLPVRPEVVERQVKQKVAAMDSLGG